MALKVLHPYVCLNLAQPRAASVGYTCVCTQMQMPAGSSCYRLQGSSALVHMPYDGHHGQHTLLLGHAAVLATNLWFVVSLTLESVCMPSPAATCLARLVVFAMIAAIAYVLISTLIMIKMVLVITIINNITDGFSSSF